jgi:hypothetical protein
MTFSSPSFFVLRRQSRAGESNTDFDNWRLCFKSCYRDLIRPSRQSYTLPAIEPSERGHVTDEVVTEQAALQYSRAGSEPKVVKWYEARHEDIFKNAEAFPRRGGVLVFGLYC